MDPRTTTKKNLVRRRKAPGLAPDLAQKKKKKKKKKEKKEKKPAHR